MTLGQRIRRLRTVRHITLAKLSQSTDLTISFLSQVERDVVSPSVKSIQKIASALGASPGTLFDEPAAPHALVVRQRARPRVVNAKARAVVEGLASGLLQLSVEPKLLTIQSGGRLGTDAMLRGSEAFGFVVSGRVELIQQQDERVIMHKGDSIYLRHPWPCTMVNTGAQQAEVVWVVWSTAA